MQILQIPRKDVDKMGSADLSWNPNAYPAEFLLYLNNRSSDLEGGGIAFEIKEYNFSYCLVLAQSLYVDARQVAKEEEDVDAAVPSGGSKYGTR